MAKLPPVFLTLDHEHFQLYIKAIAICMSPYVHGLHLAVSIFHVRLLTLSLLKYYEDAQGTFAAKSLVHD